MSNIAALYFVKTELETLAAEIIANEQERGSTNVMVYQSKLAPHCIKPGAFELKLSLPYNRSRGMFAQKREILRNLNSLRDSLRATGKRFAEIHVHLPRLSTAKTNYAINYLKKAFPKTRLTVRLIPHGLVSVNLIPLSASKRWKYLKKKLNPLNLLFPKLVYCPPTKDLVGGLDDIVDRVYTFKGLATPYPDFKVVELADLKGYIQGGNARPVERSAVIIGQSLLTHHFMSEADHATVEARIHEWLKQHGYDKVFYSRHPRAGDKLDFHRDEYQPLVQNGAVEIALCEVQPEVVISCYSTALVTAKILFGEGIRALSFGLEFAKTDKRDGLLAYFEEVGIELY